MSGRTMQRISLYFPRELLKLIDGRLPTGELDETQGRSEWIREACRQRILTDAQTMAKEVDNP
jgi:metal-responsive CopG/Arc/MetJ family transcriptional regulator